MDSLVLHANQTLPHPLQGQQREHYCPSSRMSASQQMSLVSSWNCQMVEVQLGLFGVAATLQGPVQRASPGCHVPAERHEAQRWTLILLPVSVRRIVRKRRSHLPLTCLLYSCRLLTPEQSNCRLLMCELACELAVALAAGKICMSTNEMHCMVSWVPMSTQDGCFVDARAHPTIHILPRSECHLTGCHLTSCDRVQSGELRLGAGGVSSAQAGNFMKRSKDAPVKKRGYKECVRVGESASHR
jgi:hypothetical protein